ncbi:tetratricopeptide repeat protein [Thalassomonas actiniarum]|uniref:Tetratricopeptide repeat protein n=1 Tax=Thalassomonas actiniarum TaxID=485447 RepID=A0AAE9YWI0_9GAMM|nr:tetratricopeptide repeat protein [Thalassomonas actiniarum]WDE02481.1 tetratricopeptide repeat protein [Thalassomonas actiniarum]
MKNLLIAVIAVTVITGCLSTPSAKKSVLMPAKINGMQGVKSIAVIQVDGTDKPWYSDLKKDALPKFEAFLANVDVDGERYFNVIDQSHIKRVKEEQQISSQATSDEETAIKLGRSVSADTVFMAHYQVSDIETSTYQAKAQGECLKEHEATEKVTKFLGEGSGCYEYDEITVDCEKKTVNVEFTPKATKVESGEIVYAKTYKASATFKECPNEENKTLKSNSSLVSDSLDIIFAQMRRDIAPYSLLLNLKLIDGDNTAMPETVKGVFDRGLFFAENDMLDRACAKFEQAASDYSQSPALMYNLGVCLDIKGESDSAKGFYEQALDLSAGLSSSDTGLVLNAIKRLEGKTDLDNHNKRDPDWPLKSMQDSITNLFQ